MSLAPHFEYPSLKRNFIPRVRKVHIRQKVVLSAKFSFVNTIVTPM